MKMNLISLLALSLSIAAPAVAQHSHGPAHQAPHQPTAAGHGGHAGHGAMNMEGMSPAAKASRTAELDTRKPWTS